jgi:tetratricopeptide (TPR) repeat protein
VHEKLIRHAPRHPGVHHFIGETLDLLKLPERAIASYERAARLRGAAPPTWLDLAALYERGHRLEEAEELIERTIRAGVDLPMVSLLRGRIQRRQNRFDEAKEEFQEVIARLPEDSEWVCQAWSELALIKDSEGDFDGACNAIEQCKRVQRLHEGVVLQKSEKLHAQMQELTDKFTRDDPDLVSSEERDFIGREVLDAVTSRSGKMLLIDALRKLNVNDIQSHRQRYFRAMDYLLGEPIRGRMHLDKNPAYNLTIPLVLRIFPEMRLIIALRDPRDVVLSCYVRYLPLNAVSVRFLDIERTANKYALDMTAWLKLRELIDVPWCEIKYEDTVADLEAQARRALLNFEMRWDGQVLNYRQRLTSSKQITSPSYEAVAQPIYSRAIGRWKNYEKLLAPALSILEPFVREFGYDS